MYYKGKFYHRFELSVPGIHNVSNALSCIALCDKYGISKENMYTALKKFTGANRRFEYIGECNGAHVYDDYAHHPTELRATYEALKLKKFNKSWAVFQSHTYSRTYKFLNEFADALSGFDNIIVTDIYAAREDNVYDVSPESIVDKLKEKNKNALFISGYDNVAQFLKENIKSDDLVITIGAGPVVEVAKKIVEKL